MTAWSSSVNPRKASSGSGSLASSIAALRRSSLVACGVLAPRVRSGFGCDGAEGCLCPVSHASVRCSDNVRVVLLASTPKSEQWAGQDRFCGFCKSTKTRTLCICDAVGARQVKKPRRHASERDRAPARRRSGLLARTTLEGPRRPRVEGASVDAIGATSKLQEATRRRRSRPSSLREAPSPTTGRDATAADESPHPLNKKKIPHAFIKNAT